MGMEGKKLCILFSHASSYREPIYRLIDRTYRCEWHFSDEEGGVPRFDTNIFENVAVHKHRRFGRFHWIDGINGLLAKRENKTFLMLAGTVDLSCWLFFLRAKLFYPQKKIYLWGHGWYGKETRLEAFIKRLIFNSVSGIFVYGNYARKLMIETGIDGKKIFVLHNSLNYAEQLDLRAKIERSPVYESHFGNTDPNLIFIGRLTAVKKLNQVIRALAALKGRGVSCNLTFVGDGPMKETLIRLADDLDLRDRVWFYGASYDEKANAELIYNADLCVAPGNVGLTAIHAMMFGCPVVSHNDFKWQMPEFESIVPGVTGDFFERDRVESLTGVIERWLRAKTSCREEVRTSCFREIDTQWNPGFQIEVIKNNLDFAKE